MFYYLINMNYFILFYLLIAAIKFDRYHPSSPSLEAFMRVPLKPGEFREVVKGTFGVVLTPRETIGIVRVYAPHVQAHVSSNQKTNKKDDPMSSASALLDPKTFINKFVKLGFDERSRFKLEMLEKQRQQNFIREQEKIRKKLIADQKMILDVDKVSNDAKSSDDRRFFFTIIE